jgi:hypothetical protein
MSSVSSSVSASLAQAASAAREVASARSSDRNQAEQGGGRSNRAVGEVGEVVTTTDGDTQVFADSEGLGSQGKEGDEDKAAEEDGTPVPAPPPSEAGIHQDSQGQWHVDMEA